MAARFRDWTARIASVLRVRPRTRGPRLSRGPHVMVGSWFGRRRTTARLAVSPAAAAIAVR